ncbi:hypothetical protein [Enterobacter chuandaensis]|uniref:hypothetical protein n=1 Tax=Enterobacter chuandaensis TaxID=2497875 RepID=UPI0020C60A45|nr:hypothetical protein [Enterobacter chuandaensis]
MALIIPTISSCGEITAGEKRTGRITEEYQRTVPAGAPEWAIIKSILTVILAPEKLAVYRSQRLVYHKIKSRPTNAYSL